MDALEIFNGNVFIFANKFEIIKTDAEMDLWEILNGKLPKGVLKNKS